MDITKDIQPMTTFRNHSAEMMQHLKVTKRPVTLTVNGKAAAVVQDVDAYQQLLDIAATASAPEGIRQGLEDTASGRTRAAHLALDDFCERHGLPRLRLDEANQIATVMHIRHSARDAFQEE